MKRFLIILVALAACGGSGDGGPLVYSSPKTGKLLLVKNKASTGKEMVLDLVVGKDALTGYSTGFDLPIDASLVTLADFKPGTALDPGSSPAAAQASIQTDGPLANMLVAAQSQKAAGAGAVATDTQLAPGAVLFTLYLQPVAGMKGIVFDGTASGFTLPSGGLRDRAGNSVVDPADVAIGKLELK